MSERRLARAAPANGTRGDAGQATNPVSRPYPLDNDSPYAAAQHAALSALLDPFSTWRTSTLLDPRGRRCLEVGAGGGGYASWLATQVGPGGSVLATDLKPGHIPRHPNLRVQRHDLNSDAPLGEGWDLIHARLTLGHLPQRRAILHRMATALAPGGVLLIEDWDASRTDMVLAAPSIEAAELYTRYQETLSGRVFAAAGTDRGWARRIHPAMLDEGLTDVQTLIHARAWAGGTPGCRLIASTLAQLHGPLLAAGLTARELDQVHRLLDDARLVLAGHLLYSTSGRRPSTVESPGRRGGSAAPVHDD